MSRAAALLAFLLYAACAQAFDASGSEQIVGGATAGPDAEAIGVPDEEQSLEREQTQKLRRAREELESRRAEAARRLEAGQLRQREMSRLQGDVSTAARRESFIGHEVQWMQRDRDSGYRDPADHSSMVRRDDIDRQLHLNRNELDRAGAVRQSGTDQLNRLRLR